MLIVTLLLFWMVANLFLADDPMNFATSAPSMQIFFTVVLFSLLLTGYILIGHMVNYKMRRHRFSLDAIVIL